MICYKCLSVVNVVTKQDEPDEDFPNMRRGWTSDFDCFCGLGGYGPTEEFAIKQLHGKNRARRADRFFALVAANMGNAASQGDWHVCIDVATKAMSEIERRVQDGTLFGEVGREEG